eukprot:scaffold754_cov289-Pavlova_lutheri.AAC.6
MCGRPRSGTGAEEGPKGHGGGTEERGSFMDRNDMEKNGRRGRRGREEGDKNGERKGTARGCERGEYNEWG